MLKKFILPLSIGANVVLLLLFLHVAAKEVGIRVHVGYIQMQVDLFEQMEEQVKDPERDVRNAVGSMEYALITSPVIVWPFIDPGCTILLETLRRNSIQRMVATLRTRFPEFDKGDSPGVWLDAYGYGNIDMDYIKTSNSDFSKWYREWYGDMEVLNDADDSDRENNQ